MLNLPSPGCLVEWRENLPPLRERWIASLAAITVIFTLWNVAGMSAWSTLIATALSALTFLAMFFPLGAGSGTSARENFRRLVRFPIFWLGIALVALILCQYFNPSYFIRLPENPRKWWTIVTIRDHVAWLPSGVSAPFGFERVSMNALRQLCIFGSAWLLLCSLWCGLRSRRVRTWLMWALVLNVALLAAFCLLRWSKDLTHEFLGHRTGAPSFFGVFSYKNHAAEFFALGLSMTISLAVAVWRKNAERFRRSGAHVLLAALALFPWISILCTASFAGFIEAAAWLVVVPALIFSAGAVQRTTKIAFAFVSVMVVGLALVWFATADMDATWTRLEGKFELIKKEQIDNRAPLRELSKNMFVKDAETEIFGWGAGSYRWIAPKYQRQMPEFLNRRGKLITRTEYAHCDPWQMLVEWGAVGAGIFFAGTAWFAAFALRNFRRWRTESVALLLGIVLFAAHACVDFVTYNPALLLTLAAAVALFKRTLAPKKHHARGVPAGASDSAEPSPKFVAGTPPHRAYGYEPDDDSDD